MEGAKFMINLKLKCHQTYWCAVVVVETMNEHTNVLKLNIKIAHKNPIYIVLI